MNSATMKEVAAVKIGTYEVELDEKKLKDLAEICDYAEQNIKDMTELNDQLLQLTDHFAGLENEIFDFLRTLVEVKKDYRTLLSLGIRRKEVAE